MGKNGRTADRARGSRCNKRFPGTPTFTLEEAERHNMPRALLSTPVPGRLYGPGGVIAEQTEIPAGSVLVDFHRDVASSWVGKHGPWYPMNVLLPDGRFCHMQGDVGAVLQQVPEQTPMRWDTDTQAWVEERLP